MSLNSIEIALWLEQRQYDALRRALENTGATVEKVMQARLEEFYNQTVPANERGKINLKLEAERLAAERKMEASMRVSAFHITEKGQDSYLVTKAPLDFLEMAKRLRRYLQGGIKAGSEGFAACLPVYKQLAECQFQDLAEEKMADFRRIAGVFRVDLDSQRVSSLDPYRGWQTYKAGDVSTAAYHAFRRESLSNEWRWSIFQEHLDEKQLEQSQAFGPEMEMV